MKCPYCGSEKVKRSHRRGLKEGLFYRFLLRAPFRCSDCKRRYLYFSSASEFQRRKPYQSVSEYIGYREREHIVDRWIINAVVTLLLLAVTVLLMFRIIRF